MELCSCGSGGKVVLDVGSDVHLLAWLQSTGWWKDRLREWTEVAWNQGRVEEICARLAAPKCVQHI